MAETDDSNKIYAEINSGWLANDVNFKNENYYKFLDFFVVSSICKELSCKGKDVKRLGWEKDVWKKGNLKNDLLNVICDNKPLSDYVYVAKRNYDIRTGINKFNLDKHFHNKREEKIVVHKKYNLNQIESIFYHIRNSFAHGRFQNYSYNKELFYIFESGSLEGVKEKLS